MELGMSAFGRRNGMGGGQPARPAFGVARPMQSSGVAPRPAEDTPPGSQFPPIESALLAPEDPLAPAPPAGTIDAMARLTERQNASGDAGSSRNEGFEASIHKIKEQVLPRLLERVDPEAAATLSLSLIHI